MTWAYPVNLALVVRSAAPAGAVLNLYELVVQLVSFCMSVAVFHLLILSSLPASHLASRGKGLGLGMVELVPECPGAFLVLTVGVLGNVYELAKGDKSA